VPIDERGYLQPFAVCKAFVIEISLINNNKINGEELRSMLISTRSVKKLAFAFVAIVFFYGVCGYGTVITRKPVSMGKDYYVVFPRGGDLVGNQNSATAALINSPVKQYITITLPGPAHQKYSKLLGPLNSKIHEEFGSIMHVESNSEIVDPGGAARFQGTTPFDVIGQYGLSPHIASTYTAIPVTGWGTEYWVVDEEEGINQGYGYYPNVYSVPDFTIIGSVNNTSVTIVPTAKTAKGRAPNVAFKITLNAGDVYYVSDAADPSGSNAVADEDPCEADFTGTHIISSQPVGVIVAQSWSTVPCGQGGGNECGDGAQEWLPPVCNWDSVYVISPAAPGENSGEIMKIGCGADGTSLTIWDPVAGPLQQGTLNAGDYWPYNTPITSALLITANGPILPVEIPISSSLCEPGSGPQGFNNAMCFLSGANQWSDYTAFSTADQGVNSTANVFFQDSNFSRLSINGMPINQLSPVFNYITEGFGWITFPIYQGQYYELTGDSGAVAGGSIFGDGVRKGSANNGGGDQIMDPETAGSFAHPIGINALPACIVDTSIPEDVITYICGVWTVTTSDETGDDATGIYDISLAENNMPDSSFNVAFYPNPPSFAYGAPSVGPFMIDVQNLAQPAQASLHVRTQVGNEFDTILTYAPVKLSTSPEVNVGSWRNLTGTTDSVVITNLDSVNNVVINKVRLHFGTQWKIDSTSAPFADTLAPLASVTIYLQYTASNNPQLQIDYDTVLVTTCREFPYATLVGQNKRPAITATDHDFGCLTIDTTVIDTNKLTGVMDTVNIPGETATTANLQIYIQNVGTDTLHIYGWSLLGAANTGTSTAEANSDFTILSPQMPEDSANAFVILPDSTLSIIVSAHPIHSQYDSAMIVYEDDANHIIKDTSYLYICGLAPGVRTTNANYGTMLYGTTKDSFIVAVNTGQVPVTVNTMQNIGPDKTLFVGQQYQDQVSLATYQYPTQPNPLAVGDSAKYPYHFIADRLGAATDSVLFNFSTQPLQSWLAAYVIQPHIWGTGNVSPDSTFLGGTDTQSVTFGNFAGPTGDILIIDQLIIGGPDAAAWTINTINDNVSGMPVAIPTNAAPVTMQPGDSWQINMTFNPTTKVGPYNATVQAIGHDSLGRHSLDSAGIKNTLIDATVTSDTVNHNPSGDTVVYTWNRMPYDTTVLIGNLAFAQGSSAIGDSVATYCTWQIGGVDSLFNTGGGSITIDSIVAMTNYPDNQYFPVPPIPVPPFQIPGVMPPKSSAALTFTFAPGGNPSIGDMSGDRNYIAGWIVYNSTGIPDTIINKGRGFVARMATSIPCPLPSINPPASETVPVQIDSWDDSLGMAYITGMIFEMTYYNRSVVNLDTTYNKNGQGQIGTIASGSVVAVNGPEDALYSQGVRGYYELNIAGNPSNMARTGTLLNFKIQGILGLDSSSFVYNIKDLTDSSSQGANFVAITSTNGCVTVDSICGVNVSKISYNEATSIGQNTPNPFSDATDINFALPTASHARLTVINELGAVVATPLDQDLTAGEFNVHFDGSNLPSGIYYYRLQTNAGAYQRTMTIVK